MTQNLSKIIEVVVFHHIFSNFQIQSAQSKLYIDLMQCNTKKEEEMFMKAFKGKVMQGVLRLIWSGRIQCFFVDLKRAKI